MTQEISWELYRSFLAVITTGSLSGAARAMGIAQPTVGRHVATLEAALSQVLFTRSPSGLMPTDAARALRGYAETLRNTAAALEREAASYGRGIAGTVRVSASEVIGVEVLPPALAQLRAKHPGLRIELVPTNRVQDLMQREVDIAVRMTPPKQELLIARRVGEVELGLHARADYLALHGTPRNLTDLEKHALIGFDEETPYLRTARRRFPLWSREAFAWRTDSDLAQLALIRAGAGIGICQVALAKREPRLVRVLSREAAFKLDTWITMHEDLRTSLRCKAVFDALVACLKRHVI